MLAVAAVVAGIAAASAAANYAPEIARAGRDASRNVANSLIPASFGTIGRDSREMKALNTAPKTTLNA